MAKGQTVQNLRYLSPQSTSPEKINVPAQYDLLVGLVAQQQSFTVSLSATGQFQIETVTVDELNHARVFKLAGSFLSKRRFPLGYYIAQLWISS